MDCFVATLLAMTTELTVMAGLDPAIHVFASTKQVKTWMPGTRPGMTGVVVVASVLENLT